MSTYVKFLVDGWELKFLKLRVLSDKTKFNKQNAESNNVLWNWKRKEQLKLKMKRKIKGICDGERLRLRLKSRWLRNENPMRSHNKGSKFSSTRLKDITEDVQYC